jgi:cation/acetate symporter
MLSGLGVTLLYIFTYKGWFFLPGTNMLPNTPANHLLGISPEAFGAVGAMVNFAVAWLVSRVTAAPPQHIVDMVESIRVPRGAGAATDH